MITGRVVGHTKQVLGRKGFRTKSPNRLTVTLETDLPRRSSSQGQARHLHEAKLRPFGESSYLMFKWGTVVAVVQPKNDFVLVASMNLRKEGNTLISSCCRGQGRTAVTLPVPMLKNRLARPKQRRAKKPALEQRPVRDSGAGDR